MDKEKFDAQYEKLDINNDKVITMNELKKQGLTEIDFEQHLAIGIIWIGYTLDPNYQQHKEIME